MTPGWFHIVPSWLARSKAASGYCRLSSDHRYHLSKGTPSPYCWMTGKLTEIYVMFVYPISDCQVGARHLPSGVLWSDNYRFNLSAYRWPFPCLCPQGVGIYPSGEVVLWQWGTRGEKAISFTFICHFCNSCLMTQVWWQVSPDILIIWMTMGKKKERRKDRKKEKKRKKERKKERRKEKKRKERKGNEK